MPFGNQTAGRINDPFSTVIHRAAINQFAATSLFAQTKRFVSDQFVGRKTIVQLDYVYVLWAKPGFIIGFLSSRPAHFGPNQTDTTILEGTGRVGSHRH